MSFDEQWATLRTQAAERQATRMQINSFHDGGAASPGEKLKVTSKVLRDMADKADGTRRNFAKADNQAKMRYVQGLLEHGVAGALRNAAADFQIGNKDTADTFRDHDGNKRVAR